MRWKTASSTDEDEGHAGRLLATGGSAACARGYDAVGRAADSPSGPDRTPRTPSVPATRSSRTGPVRAGRGVRRRSGGQGTVDRRRWSSAALPSARRARRRAARDGVPLDARRPPASSVACSDRRMSSARASATRPRVDASRRAGHAGDPACPGRLTGARRRAPVRRDGSGIARPAAARAAAAQRAQPGEPPAARARARRPGPVEDGGTAAPGGARRAGEPGRRRRAVRRAPGRPGVAVRRARRVRALDVDLHPDPADPPGDDVVERDT